MKKSTSKIFVSSICAVLATTGMSNAASVITIDPAGATTDVGPDLEVDSQLLRTTGLIVDAGGTVTALSGNILAQQTTTTIDINGGTFIAESSIGNAIFIGNGGAGNHTFTITDGLADFNLTVGVGRDEAVGVIDIQGGVVEISGNLDFFNGSNGNAAGVGSVINFGTDATSSLTVDGSIIDEDNGTVSFEDLFNTGFLTADGQVAGDSFADVFQVDGNTLSLVPEPSSTALLGLGGLALLMRRRK